MGAKASKSQKPLRLVDGAWHGEPQPALPLLRGRAGEHFVAAELLRRGFLASLTPMNAPFFDILASCGGRLVRVRVKTMSAEKAEMWQWSVKKDGVLFPGFRAGMKDDFTVLVRIRGERERPEFYVVPTGVLYRKLKKQREEYAETHGFTRHVGLKYRQSLSWLKRYEDAWQILGFVSPPRGEPTRGVLWAKMGATQRGHC